MSTHTGWPYGWTPSRSRGRFESPPLEEAVSSFWNRVEYTDSCWVWKGAARKHGLGNGGGYGRVGWRGTVLYAHRLAYELRVGPIAEGMTLDHLCGNRLCVRPDHLEPVSRGENVRRALKGKPRCRRVLGVSGDSL